MLDKSYIWRITYEYRTTGKNGISTWSRTIYGTQERLHKEIFNIAYWDSVSIAGKSLRNPGDEVVITKIAQKGQ